MKYLGTLLLLILFVACTTPRVMYDYDKKVNFEKYKTYNFYPDIDTGLSDLDNKRLFRQADSILQSRGFVRTATPDFYINIETSAFQPNQNGGVGVGVGGGGRNAGGGISIGLPINAKLNQQLVFDFVDVREDDLYWQAVAEGYYKEKATPEEREAYFRRILLKVLKGYPPKR
ncbi:DUF4136 domain-containing protein [Kordia algicida OT-1]|uniref:DUF4136 domain-containing protein n=1 Tax=Kordia algicida OT-1 TaxID=391587 RepID=A9E1C7_9FLAO|nr:DUF4136 domain-containing protein [Kordia algicida]EDP95612.1 hypothetical protein KAOT1_22211 [Kordia algicida OT-1]